MRSRTAIGLVVLGATALVAALVWHPASDTQADGGGQPVFPGIAASLAKATKVEISGAGKTATLVLAHGSWGLAERGGYPIIEPKLRAVLSGLVELKRIEPRTSEPAELGKLGVDDPAAAGSTATLLTVDDEAGHTIASLILGHRRTRSQGGLPEAVYIRTPGDRQSWLAEGSVPTDSDPTAWLVRDVADIPASRIVKVVATRGADTLVFTRSGDTFALTPPGDVKLDSYRVEAVSRALADLTLTDVKPGPLPGDALGQTEFTTDDGLTLTVSLSKQGETLWAGFSASGKGAEAYARLDGWSFALSDWREKAILPALAELKADEPPKAAPTQ